MGGESSGDEGFWVGGGGTVAGTRGEMGKEVAEIGARIGVEIWDRKGKDVY